MARDGAIGFAHLHHCIVGTFEVLAAIITGGAATGADFARFLVLATAGNAVGEVFFVGLLEYGHATQIRPGLRH